MTVGRSAKNRVATGRRRLVHAPSGRLGVLHRPRPAAPEPARIDEHGRRPAHRKAERRLPRRDAVRPQRAEDGAPAGVSGRDRPAPCRCRRNQLTQGARIATFGRWIVDQAPDFHTESIRPCSRPSPSRSRRSQRRRRRGTACRLHHEAAHSQPAPEGNFVDHLIAEVVKVETTIFESLSFRVEAHPTVYTTL